MRIFRHFTELPDDARGGAVAIGNFDGVHMGHREVVAAARSHASDLKAPVAVLTFEPHPRSVFQPHAPPFRLTPFRTKAHEISKLGVDVLFVLHFDMAFAARTAEDFVETVLVRGLGTRHVVTGYDFIFGHNRTGDAEFLAAKSAELGFGYTRVGSVVSEPGEPYSSTRIRDALAAGKPDRAAELLGRAWEIEGRVEEGKKVGRDLGFPTANIPLGEYLHPMPGIYAIRARIDDGVIDGAIDGGGFGADADAEWRDGVANIGIAPSFEDRPFLLEAHLFDFDGNLYGKHLRVQIVAYVRPEAAFPDMESLKAQIADDCAVARRVLSAYKSADPVTGGA